MYGLSTIDYRHKLSKQLGGCAICGKPEKKALRGILYVDHDHKTGKVRGLLCNECNSMLGYAKDDKKILLIAIKYLEAYSG